MFRTKRQLVEFITNPYYGRMLFLDAVLQSTTSDEAIYHKALVDAGMRKESSRILIVGGAEGGVAREVLKWPVKYVQMVDWDSHLVNHCKNVEKFNTEAFNDPRFFYSDQDINEFCMRHDTFDTVFIDLLDVDTERDYEYMREILRILPNVCGKGVRIIMNVGRSRSMASRFGDVIEVDVPSFQEPWYFASS